MKQLEPCPRCDGVAKALLRDGKDSWIVQCMVCSLRTDAFVSPMYATEAWNNEFPRKEDWSVSRIIFVGVPLALLFFYSLVWSMLEFYSFVEGWIKNG
jgi:hypothetical protein